MGFLIPDTIFAVFKGNLKGVLKQARTSKDFSQPRRLNHLYGFSILSAIVFLAVLSLAGVIAVNLIQSMNKASRRSHILVQMDNLASGARSMNEPVRYLNALIQSPEMRPFIKSCLVPTGANCPTAADLTSFPDLAQQYSSKHVVEMPIVDSRGEVIAGTSLNPTFWSNNGLLCSSSPSGNSSCSLETRGFAVMDSSSNPGPVRFLLVARHHRENQPSDTPIADRIHAIDIGEEYLSPSAEVLISALPLDPALDRPEGYRLEPPGITAAPREVAGRPGDEAQQAPDTIIRDSIPPPTRPSESGGVGDCFEVVSAVRARFAGGWANGYRRFPIYDGDVIPGVPNPAASWGANTQLFILRAPRRATTIAQAMSPFVELTNINPGIRSESSGIACNESEGWTMTGCNFVANHEEENNIPIKNGCVSNTWGQYGAMGIQCIKQCSPRSN